MKTAFIFGLGYVGLPLAQALAEKGWQIRGTTRTPSKLESKIGVGWEILPFAANSPLANPKRAFADIDVIISTGGTGLTKRDVSVEAHSQVYEKEITAFPSMFASISMEKIGTSALQSRACAGVRNGTYLFALPGSPSACRDAWENLLRPQFDYRHLPCNFVEIMPRLVKDSMDKS